MDIADIEKNTAPVPDGELTEISEKLLEQFRSTYEELAK